MKDLGQNNPTYPLTAFGNRKPKILNLNTKFNLIVQKAPHFDEDGGVRIRGYMFRYNNQFQTPKNLNYKFGNSYEAKPIITRLREDETYKYTMLNFMLSWGHQYYLNKDFVSHIPKYCKDMFLKCCDMNTRPEEKFISENLQLDPRGTNRVYKQEIERLWCFVNNGKQMTRQELQKLNKALEMTYQIPYKRRMAPRKSDKAMGITKCGCYVGLKIVNTEWNKPSSGKICDIDSSDDEYDPLDNYIGQ